MSREQLTCLLNGLETAADVVEAIDDPRLQRPRGWDLSGWGYHLVPWGVRFTDRGPAPKDKAEVMAVINFGARPTGPEVPGATVVAWASGSP